MDSLDGQTFEGQCVDASLDSLDSLDSHSGHENPATYQDEEETQRLKPEEIPITALKQQQALVMVEKRGGKRPSSDVSRPASSSSSTDTTDAEPSHHQPQREPRVVSKTLIKWSCRTCQRECIPVREESRCLWYSAG